MSDEWNSKAIRYPRPAYRTELKNNDNNSSSEGTGATDDSNKIEYSLPFPPSLIFRRSNEETGATDDCNERSHKKHAKGGRFFRLTPPPSPPPSPPSFPPPPIEFQSALQVYVSELEKLNEEYSEKYNKKKDQFHQNVQKEIDYHQNIIRKREEYRHDVEGEFDRLFSSWKSDFAEKLEEAKSQIDLLKSGEDKKRSDIPNHLLCPLTLDIMKDPVMASDGFTYEREAIERVLNSSDNPKSPMTNEPFDSCTLFQNNAIRSLCREYSSK